MKPLDEDLGAFISENAEDAAYWSHLVAEAVRIEDQTLLIYATKKAAAYARAFVGAVKDMLDAPPMEG